ncbi:hypothetical protein F5144DRAFT_348550 [Chaetomium tenue]|uniref:Uncharacterized protein n=1 Tax=Chaetomium tenue TaxID=1854479 RepID=A0ACB7P1V7_9PEZI|nr:hypothetical protein F5144DRAFT_348550 [Chaetomium globosum]
MKLSWLLPALLVGGGASVVSDKVLVNGKVILKTVPYQRQDTRQDGASIQSPSANTITVDLDTLNIALPSQKNRTEPKVTVQREASDSDHHEESLPVITLRATNRDPQDPPPQLSESSGPDPHPDLDEASTSASHGPETRNPASANRAIAGMGVGLVSVMLIFTVFL